MITNSSSVGRRCIEVCPVPECVTGVKLHENPPRRERVLNSGVAVSVIFRSMSVAKDGVSRVPQDAVACDDVLKRVEKVENDQRIVIGGTARCPHSAAVKYSSASPK